MTEQEEQAVKLEHLTMIVEEIITFAFPDDQEHHPNVGLLTDWVKQQEVARDRERQDFDDIRRARQLLIARGYKVTEIDSVVIPYTSMAIKIDSNVD